ncbi:MAG: aromatic amino acid ammonia-lyase [Phycisphaerales bacterium]
MPEAPSPSRPRPGLAPAARDIEPALRLSPDTHLDARQLTTLAALERPGVEFGPSAIAAMERSEAALLAAHAAGTPIYGLTTGFGPLVCFDASAGGGHPEGHGAGLLAHLGAGWGTWMPATVVRAAMIARCATLSRGFSGIGRGVAESLAALLGHGIVPAVPELGSVGASGDLVPMAHVARVMTGAGLVRTEAGDAVPAAGVLHACGLAPQPLSGREALSLVNGTNFMTAYAALSLDAADRLLAHAESLTGWIYRLLGARAEALDPRLHRARGHAGQLASAAAIRAEASRDGDWEDVGRPLQEVYSLRCAPQFLGACRDQLQYARQTIETELNGVSDNPVTWACEGAPAILHGGNFQGQQLAFAADSINAAMVQCGVLAERQLDVLLNPEFNGDAPPLLAWEPGPTAGMAGAQITATALVAEMRHHGGPAATSSMPTNGRNQDVVSMGLMAARQAHGQADRLAGILAILMIGGRQLDHLRTEGRATGPHAAPPHGAPAYEPFNWDRALEPDVRRIATELLRVSPED